MYHRNPFIYNAPVIGEQFINREKIIKNILDTTVDSVAQGSIWITGERQIGKTSLLKFIEKEKADTFEEISIYEQEIKAKPAFVYVNVQDCRTLDDFYNYLRQALKNRFDFKIEKTENVYNNFINSIDYLYKERYFIIFLIDEFDAFIQILARKSKEEASHLFNWLNRILGGIFEIKGSPKVFCCVFTSNSKIDDLLNEIELKKNGSGLNVSDDSLNLFNKKETEELIEKYLADNSVLLSKKDMEFCYKMTKGYPYFVQRLLYIMYNLKNDPDINEKNLLRKAKAEYEKILINTVEKWGGKNMPKLTINKISELIGTTSQKVANIGFAEAIREWIRNLI